MSPATKVETIFVGCDPGFTAPCLCVMGDSLEPLAVKFIDGKEYKTWDDYSRAFQLGKMMADFVNENWPTADVVLAIEGPSYGSKKNSSSMEQMALCRQAIYDAFEVKTNLVDWHQVAPPTVKKVLTGNGRADKETVITFARVVAPKIMADKETFREKKKRNGTVELEINKRTEAIADSIAIAMTGKRKWET